MRECLLDTDILSYYLKDDKVVKSNVEKYLIHGEFTELTISEITYYEIKAGLEYKTATKQLALFDDFALNLKIVSLTKSSLNLSAKLYGDLRRKGISIGTPDLLIAGTAIVNELVLVTNNIKHYSPIETLEMNNWKEK